MRPSITASAAAVATLVTASMFAQGAVQVGSWTFGGVAIGLVTITFVLVAVANHLFDAGR